MTERGFSSARNRCHDQLNRCMDGAESWFQASVNSLLSSTPNIDSVIECEADPNCALTLNLIRSVRNLTKLACTSDFRECIRDAEELEEGMLEILIEEFRDGKLSFLKSSGAGSPDWAKIETAIAELMSEEKRR